jgi:electron transfer flavoprotein beta subunit
LGPMLAEWLKLPFMGFVRKLELREGAVKAELALEGHEEVAEADLPAVVSVVSEINSPRYPTLLQIMQASKKPMEEVTLESLKGADAPQGGVRVLDIHVQSMNRKKVILEGTPEESADKLVEALQKEGVI